MGLFDLFKTKNKKGNIGMQSETMENRQEQTVEVKKPDSTVSTGIGINSDTEIPSLQSLIAKSSPSKNGLYPHEIAMLDYAGSYKTSNNCFQHFWLYEYSVEHPQEILDSLCERGFVTIGDLRSALEKLKVPDIKSELQAVGEKVTGKKLELVDRLMERGNLHELESKYSERYFVLTDLGVRELNENGYVPYLHRHRYMSAWDMNFNLHNNNPSHLKYRDILWREFNSISGEYFQSGDMGLYRNTRLNMYQFLMEEKKHKTAFALLCEVVTYDLSGMGNNEKFDADHTWKKFVLEQSLEMNFPYEKSCATLPPAVIGWLGDMKNVLELSEESFKAEIYHNIEEIKLYRRLFTNDQCVEIVIHEMNNNKEKLNQIYNQAEVRLKEEISKYKDVPSLYSN